MRDLRIFESCNKTSLPYEINKYEYEIITADNILYISDILICSVIIMLPHIPAEDSSHEDDNLIYADEYLDIARSQTGYMKRLRIRRLICRVCRLKFRTRQETQAHIRREHRKVQVNG
jgi:hypothetical protein